MQPALGQHRVGDGMVLQTSHLACSHSSCFSCSVQKTSTSGTISDSDSVVLQHAFSWDFGGTAKSHRGFPGRWEASTMQIYMCAGQWLRCALGCAGPSCTLCAASSRMRSRCRHSGMLAWFCTSCDVAASRKSPASLVLATLPDTCTRTLRSATASCCLP